jgi:hypothetical protein
VFYACFRQGYNQAGSIEQRLANMNAFLVDLDGEDRAVAV